MQTRTTQAVIDQEILAAADCEHDFACLDDAAVCETVLFTHRDVEVVKCLVKSPCGKRMSCAGMQICTCPVKKRLHGLRP